MFLKLDCLLSLNIEFENWNKLISNSYMKITLLSSLFKYFNIQEKDKNTPYYMPRYVHDSNSNFIANCILKCFNYGYYLIKPACLSFLCLYTQRSYQFLKQLQRRLEGFWLSKDLEIWKILQKYNIFAHLQDMFVISLSSFVIQQQILNLTNQCSLFITVHYVFWDQWGWPPTQHRWSPTPAIIDEL
jgi:hypothetical protein